MGYKRNFRRKVRGVIRADQETKRVIQTRQSNFANESPDQLSVYYQNPKTTLIPGVPHCGDAEWNSYCWSIIHNTPKFFPVNLVGCNCGTMSGYSVGINAPGGHND